MSAHPASSPPTVTSDSDLSPDLGPLGDPQFYTEPLDISGSDIDRLRSFHERMLLIRKVEEEVGELVASGEARCPCHLAIGQEAVAVGVATSVTPDDRVFGAHRSHGHYLALGGDVVGLFAEILGKDAGCSKGMGGSMHLHDDAIGLLGTVPIVAATIPIAVGAALAAKMDGNDAVAISFFGDGATEEGVFHESLNLAAVMRLPVVFVCENNLFSSHLHIGLRQPHDSVARYAAAHGVPSRVVDGNDVLAVDRAAAELVDHSRRGGGPGFLEAVTYRWRGHVGHREDIDVGVRRNEELPLWKHRDPIERLEKALVSDDHMTAEAVVELGVRLDRLIGDAVATARDAPYPSGTRLLDSVYAPSRP